MFKYRFIKYKDDGHFERVCAADFEFHRLSADADYRVEDGGGFEGD